MKSTELGSRASQRECKVFANHGTKEQHYAEPL
jgi:hypothetical protein